MQAELSNLFLKCKIVIIWIIILKRFNNLTEFLVRFLYLIVVDLKFGSYENSAIKSRQYKPLIFIITKVYYSSSTAQQTSTGLSFLGLFLSYSLTSGQPSHLFTLKTIKSFSTQSNQLTAGLPLLLLTIFENVSFLVGSDSWWQKIYFSHLNLCDLINLKMFNCLLYTYSSWLYKLLHVLCSFIAPKIEWKLFLSKVSSLFLLLY